MGDDLVLFAPTDLVKIIYQTILLTNPQYLYHVAGVNYIVAFSDAMLQSEVEVL